MPLDLTHLQARKARAVAHYAGEDIWLEYRPERYDLAAHHKLVGLRDAPEFDPLVEVLAALLAGWDLTDGDRPFPPSPENLRRLSVPLLTELARAVLEDASAGAGASKNGKSPSLATS